MASVSGVYFLKLKKRPRTRGEVYMGGASFPPTRKTQSASGVKPHLENIVKRSTSRTSYHAAKACGILVNTASKTKLTPEVFASLIPQTQKTEPSRSSGDGRNIFQTAQQMFTQRTTGMAIGTQVQEKPDISPENIRIPKSSTPGRKTNNTGEKGKKEPSGPTPDFLSSRQSGALHSYTEHAKRKGGGGKEQPQLHTTIREHAVQNMTGTRGTGIDGMGKTMELKRGKAKGKSKRTTKQLSIRNKNTSRAILTNI